MRGNSAKIEGRKGESKKNAFHGWRKKGQFIEKAGKRCKKSPRKIDKKNSGMI